MSWRNDHAGLMRFERAHDHNHSRSSGEGSMCGQNASEQVRVRQAFGLVQTVLLREVLKLMQNMCFCPISSVLMQYAG